MRELLPSPLLFSALCVIAFSVSEFWVSEFWVSEFWVKALLTKALEISALVLRAFEVRAFRFSPLDDSDASAGAVKASIAPNANTFRPKWDQFTTYSFIGPSEGWEPAAGSGSDLIQPELPEA